MEMSTHAHAGERDQSHYMHIVILRGNGTVRVNYVHMHTYRVPAPVLSALFPPLLFCPWVRALSECNAPAQRFLRASLLCMEQDRGYGHHLSAACCMLACRLSLIHSFILQKYLLGTVLDMGHRSWTRPTWPLPSWILQSREESGLCHHPSPLHVPRVSGPRQGLIYPTPQHTDKYDTSRCCFHTDLCRRTFS